MNYQLNINNKTHASVFVNNKDIARIYKGTALIWQKYQYFTIVFDSCGGSAVSPIHVQKGSAVGNLPCPTCEGKVFLGWFTASTGGTQINSETVPTEDTTYYAQYMASYMCLDKVGSVVVDENLVASGFSTTSFLVSDSNSQLNFADGLEMVFRAKTANPIANQEIFGMTNAEAFEFGANESKFMWEIAGGTLHSLGELDCEADKWYYWKVVKAVGVYSYQCYVADASTVTDTPEWTLDYGPVTRSATAIGTFAIGIDYWGGSATAHIEPWLGQIDLKNSYMLVNNKKILFKMN